MSSDSTDVELFSPQSPFFGSDPQHAFVTGLQPGSDFDLASSLIALREFAFSTLLLSVLYCALTITFCMAASSLRKNGLRSMSNKLYMCAISAMFGLTTMYVVVVVAQFWVVFDVRADNTTLRGVGSWLESVVFAVNVVIGDAIILWRALVIWRWSRPLVYISGILLLETAALWLYAVIKPQANASFVSIPASMVTSLWATGAISMKAWQRRRMLHKKVAIVSRGSVLENVLAMLTESGVVFTLLWVLYFVSNFVTSSQAFYPTMTVVMTIAAPLYPIIIIILVARQRTPLCDELTSIEPLTMLEAESLDHFPEDLDGTGRKEALALY
ncbi:hypothetical protein PENSPDRAFT_685141 [Peniophora sp. CONT]|nr:hypothetical protein PENSPDRAFT_685141 [Peniophora sp. CONT]